MYVICIVNEILGAAAKERSAESPSSTEENKSSKGVCARKTSKQMEINALIRKIYDPVVLVVCFLQPAMSLQFSNFPHFH